MRNWSAVFVKIGYFIGYYTAVPFENPLEIWPIKIECGRPNAEIGRKMAKGQQLVCISSTASLIIRSCSRTYIYVCIHVRSIPADCC